MLMGSATGSPKSFISFCSGSGRVETAGRRIGVDALCRNSLRDFGSGVVLATRMRHTKTIGVSAYRRIGVSVWTRFFADMPTRRHAVSALLVFWLSLCARSQETASVNPASLTPSLETQRQAATYALTTPAPRGQITDRNGVPLAQNRASNNLSVAFPTPFDFTDSQVVEFVNRA